jgi:hypothetical protein
MKLVEKRRSVAQESAKSLMAISNDPDTPSQACGDAGRIRHLPGNTLRNRQ